LSGGSVRGTPRVRSAAFMSGLRAPEDCPLYLAHIIAGIKIGPSPGLVAGAALRRGPAADQQRGRCGQLRHARVRPAVARLRRAKARRSADRRAPRVEGESIVTLDGKERALSLPAAWSSRTRSSPSWWPASWAGRIRVSMLRHHGSRARGGLFPTAVDPGHVQAPGVLERFLLPLRARRGSARLPWKRLSAAIDLILQTAGGQSSVPQFSVGGDVPWQREIVVTPDFINENSALILPAADMKAAFEALELTVTREEPRCIRARPRLDR
jgi:phenylalanyl-tRNA synthetase beta chain